MILLLSRMLRERDTLWETHQDVCSHDVHSVTETLHCCHVHLLKKALLQEYKVNSSQRIPTSLSSITFSCTVIVYLILPFNLKFLGRQYRVLEKAPNLTRVLASALLFFTLTDCPPSSKR